MECQGLYSVLRSSSVDLHCTVNIFQIYCCFLISLHRSLSVQEAYWMFCLILFRPTSEQRSVRNSGNSYRSELLRICQRLISLTHALGRSLLFVTGGHSGSTSQASFSSWLTEWGWRYVWITDDGDRPLIVEKFKKSYPWRTWSIICFIIKHLKLHGQ